MGDANDRMFAAKRRAACDFYEAGEVAMMDLRRRSGDLIPVKKLRNGMLRFRCMRIRVNKEKCRNVRDIAKGDRNDYTYCVECDRLLGIRRPRQQEARREARREARQAANKVKPKYVELRDSFTAEQWQQYHAILRGRTGVEDQRDAVAMVLLGIRAA